MKLLAISDLHLSNTVNLNAFLKLRKHPGDWLILAGDIAEKFETLNIAFAHAVDCFDRVIWVPGNHELWAIPEIQFGQQSGLARYEALVALARSHGVVTPEDPFLIWPPSLGQCNSHPVIIAPLFLLYDYSFGPPGMSREQILTWAKEKRCVAADEQLLSTDPYPSIIHWCRDRLKVSEDRLSSISPEFKTVLINHFPTRRDLIHIPRIPRFIPWCGTTQTEDWHLKYNAQVVVTGHLHVRRTDWRAQTRFEEVSLGYPLQWDQSSNLANYFRQILAD